MSTAVIVILVIVMLPVYVYFLSMFAYMGKFAAIRAMMTRKKDNKRSYEEGEENHG